MILNFSARSDKNVWLKQFQHILSSTKNRSMLLIAIFTRYGFMVNFSSIKSNKVAWCGAVVLFSHKTCSHTRVPNQLYPLPYKQLMAIATWLRDQYI